MACPAHTTENNPYTQGRDSHDQPQQELQMNVLLEQRVAERTATLEAALEQARRTSTAKGLFLAKMSHEIRTPMNGIIGMLEALRTTQLDATQQNFITTAYTSAETLLALIDDILDMAKIEAGKLTVEATSFDLHALLEQVIGLWRPQAENRQLQLLHELLPEVPQYVYGDPTRLRQILNNLLSNALKFTHQGGISIVVDSLAGIDNDPCMLRFAVQDTGIGMSAITQQQLFSQFMQAEGASTTRIYGGSGLGLAICKQLINLMQGEILVDSSEGIGTCFTVVLPFARALPPSITPDPQQTGTEPPGTHTRPHHVLVVDDNETNLKVCTTMLERLGFRITIAVNGLEAVTAIKRDTFDLVLMDCHMPVMDGLDATLSIRAWEDTEQRNAVPIIAVSASAFPEDRQRCAAAGMNDFLPKPVTLSSLRKMLDTWVRPTSSHAAALPPANYATQSATTPSPTTELLQLTQLRETQALCGAGFGELIATFTVDAERQLHTLQLALNQVDADNLQQCAHKLKGASISLGAQQLSRLCHDLEVKAQRRMLDDAQADINAITNCYRTTLHALESFRAGSGNT